MDAEPAVLGLSGDSLRLDDVNGDGLADLVQVRFTDVDVWLNVDGTSWTKRHVIADTPAEPVLREPRAAGGHQRLAAPATSCGATRTSTSTSTWPGGERPSLLTHVDNGLGKTTFLEYSTSTARCSPPRSGTAASCRPVELRWTQRCRRWSTWSSA